jgi:hypothetical protein
MGWYGSMFFFVGFLFASMSTDCGGFGFLAFVWEKLIRRRMNLDTHDITIALLPLL